jgi:signal transduction histidine kinase
MSKLLNYSLRKIIIGAGIVLAASIPLYYWAISRLWLYEMEEHSVVLTQEAVREDSFLIIGAVTGLSVVFFVLLMGVLIMLNRRLSKRMWQPFYRSLEKIKSFDLHKSNDIAFEETGIAEFDELNETLKKLIVANLRVYNQQKEFADNASHELQTPLAIIRSKLELLSQSNRLDDDQYHLIEGAQAAISRAGRINKNLLLLTKIENSQFADMEQLDLSALLTEMLAQFGEFFEDKGLQLSSNITDRVVVEGNKPLIEILLGNLLTNAIRHSETTGEIRVMLSPAELTISNPGIEALQAEQLFRRFASASVTSTGTGLGLALVKQICDRYGWGINYRFSEGCHVFQVQFGA